MTVLTTAILEDEKKTKLDEDSTDPAAIPVVVTTKGSGPPVSQIQNRRSAPARNPCRIFLFIITLLGLLCALSGVCYGIYHFARIGQSRHRVFCRIFEDRAVKHSRIFSERAEISGDRHSVRLFVPTFMYAQRVFSSSVVLIIENHGITVIRLEKSRTCFVKQIQRRRRQRNQHKWVSIPDWYRKVEDGSYLPNLEIMRRSWMAKSPHMTHQEAGVAFHPKVAEFCQNMKVFRMVQMHNRIGVVPYGGGLLPRCPLAKCHPCPQQRYVFDRKGCRTCRCAIPRPPPPPPPPLPPRRSFAAFQAICGTFKCDRRCPSGFALRPNGCPRCECRRRRIAKREATAAQCRQLNVAEGIDPLEGAFRLDEIFVC